jgi:hypothetical protein
MFNMDMFFEFLQMILKNHMFKVNLSRFLKKSTIRIFIGCPNKQTRLQVDEMLNFSTNLI